MSYRPLLYLLLIALCVAAVPAPASQAASPPAVNSLPSPERSSSVASPASTIASAPPEQQTDPAASDFPNNPIFTPDSNIAAPEAVIDGLGANVLGPQNVVLDQQNPDLLAPPTTDSGSVANAKWPFSLSHNRLQSGGWARQQNLQVLPIATAMASVNMRLEAGAVRELHWHSTAEWAFVLKGSTRVTAVNSDGQVFVDTVGPGDLWYFPAGVPHSLQGTDDDPEGSEFLLVFDDGNFSEDSTFLLTDWMAHVPKEILAKNFHVNTSAFDHIPSKELYIFPAAPPSPNAQPITSPQGTVPSPFTFKFSQVNETKLQGGSIKIVDTRSFPVASTIVGALVTVEPGGMRELHWHPTQPEWSYFITGNARVTLFAASSNARTFDYQPGDIGYVPPSFGHFVENLGNTTMSYLEIFNSDLVQDISLQQWLALTPPELVKAHLDLPDDVIANLNKEKLIVV